MWANTRILEPTKRLTPAQLRSPFSIGQGSVWQTLTHLLAAEYGWLETLLGNEQPLMPGDVPERLPGNQAGEDAIESIEELIRRWRELDQLDSCMHTRSIYDGPVDQHVASIGGNGLARRDVDFTRAVAASKRIVSFFAARNQRL